MTPDRLQEIRQRHAAHCCCHNPEPDERFVCQRKGCIGGAVRDLLAALATADQDLDDAVNVIAEKVTELIATRQKLATAEAEGRRQGIEAVLAEFSLVRSQTEVENRVRQLLPDTPHP